jgi:hypothetical protein
MLVSDTIVSGNPVSSFILKTEKKSYKTIVFHLLN